MQQTSIPWGRDLVVKWENTGPSETFVVKKNGDAMVEFQVRGSDLKCVRGNEYLAVDPYTQKPQN